MIQLRIKSYWQSTLWPPAFSSFKSWLRRSRWKDICFGTGCVIFFSLVLILWKHSLMIYLYFFYWTMLVFHFVSQQDGGCLYRKKFWWNNHPCKSSLHPFFRSDGSSIWCTNFVITVSSLKTSIFFWLFLFPRVSLTQLMISNFRDWQGNVLGYLWKDLYCIFVCSTV